MLNHAGIIPNKNIKNARPISSLQLIIGPQELQHLQLIRDISGGALSTSLQPGHFVIWFSTSALNTTCSLIIGEYMGIPIGGSWSRPVLNTCASPRNHHHFVHRRDKLNRYGGCHVYHIQSRKNTKSYENCGDGSCPTVHICSAELAQWTRPDSALFVARDRATKSWEKVAQWRGSAHVPRHLIMNDAAGITWHMDDVVTSCVCWTWGILGLTF